MGKVRLTVTIPKEEYKRIEQEKVKMGISRSELVHKMIKSFFIKEDLQCKIKKYVEGYKKVPEKANYVAKLEQVQFETLNKEF